MPYHELPFQRAHWLEATTPEDKAWCMLAIDRLLDQIIDSAYDEFGPIATNLPNSPEGQAHLDTHIEKGQE